MVLEIKKKCRLGAVVVVLSGKRKEKKKPFIKNKPFCMVKRIHFPIGFLQNDTNTSHKNNMYSFQI